MKNKSPGRARVVDQYILDRAGIALQVQTHVQRDTAQAGTLPWLATLTYHHAVYAEIGYAWLTPSLSPDETAHALEAVGVDGGPRVAAIERSIAAGETGVLVSLLEPGRQATGVLRDVLSAYAICELAAVMRAQTAWLVRDHVPARVRGLLGIRARTALPSVSRANLDDTRRYLAAELFGEGRVTSRQHDGVLRMAAGRGA
jgi:hypothetical protein